MIAFSELERHLREVSVTKVPALLRILVMRAEQEVFNTPEDALIFIKKNLTLKP